MHFNWTLFLMALGLAMIIEGLPYFIWAEKMPRVLRVLSEQKPSSLRLMGLVALSVGILLIYLARQ